MAWQNQFQTVQTRRNPVILDTLDRFVYFPNNKVCQRSIARVALGGRAIVRKDGERVWREKLSEIDGEYFSRVFTFTVVRNPYDRAVSAFTYLQGLGKIGAGLSFAEFVFNTLRHVGPSFDPHFEAQSDGLFCEGGLIPRFVGRFESIDADWRRIATAIEAPSSLAHINQSARRRHYQDYYDEFSRNLIAEIYADDLANFDYQFQARGA